MDNRWLMAEKSLNMIEKMKDPNKIAYYIINCAIPSIITIENRYQIDFGKPAVYWFSNCDKDIAGSFIDYKKYSETTMSITVVVHQ